MSTRWAIWIDIEGFSQLFRIDESRAIFALGALMKALYKIGFCVFSGEGERLFIHQFGDGFVIVSDFSEDSPNRPIGICIAIMRHLLSKGIAGKASISGGSFADISGCYPQIVLEASQDRRHVKIGNGVMTILPIMGTALIAAHNLAKKRHGSVLLFDPLVFDSQPNGVIVHAGQPTVIDWIHSDPSIVAEICAAASLVYIAPQAAERKIRDYINDNLAELPAEWISSTLEAAACS